MTMMAIEFAKYPINKMISVKRCLFFSYNSFSSKNQKCTKV